MPDDGSSACGSTTSKGSSALSPPLGCASERNGKQWGCRRRAAHFRPMGAKHAGRELRSLMSGMPLSLDPHHLLPAGPPRPKCNARLMAQREEVGGRQSGLKPRVAGLVHVQTGAGAQLSGRPAVPRTTTDRNSSGHLDTPRAEVTPSTTGYPLCRPTASARGAHAQHLPIRGNGHGSIVGSDDPPRRPHGAKEGRRSD